MRAAIDVQASASLPVRETARRVKGRRSLPIAAPAAFFPCPAHPAWVRLIGMFKSAPGTSTHLTLLERVRTLDPQSWSEFVRLYDSLFTGYVESISRRYQLALKDHDREDVKQDLLIKLYRALPTFQLDRSERGRFRTWLWQVAHNVTIDWVRQNRRRLRPQRPEAARAGGDSPDPPPPPLALVYTPELPEQVAEDMPPPDEQVIQDHLWEVRRYILEKVEAETQSARKWECFDKHFLQGRRSADVAAELGLSVSAVNTYTSRVLARIRELCQYYDVEL
jgi:RNA polymerase sigma-70 factor (ECF subfamily)